MYDLVVERDGLDQGETDGRSRVSGEAQALLGSRQGILRGARANLDVGIADKSGKDGRVCGMCSQSRSNDGRRVGYKARCYSAVQIRPFRK
ncbi:hypothetical protein GCM10009530_17740 [Microbispora corallina]|uniref:Uncharacterized protein n=1 Tax=Microbispora corallina TaxID=83302 RepID=A0ABQ4FY42_9ACTN|nr:hypothetical protein Mco01_27330 [Microbispora corallina]